MVAERKHGTVSVEFTAVNFAEESSNKIHSDAVAIQYGFQGALVPGIAIYGYMARPVVAKWDLQWLTRGFIQAKFVKPVYAGDPVRVQMEADEKTADEFEIRVTNRDGTLCAVGSAGLRRTKVVKPSAASYPRKELPPAGRRMIPSADHLPSGSILGTVDFFEEFDEMETRVRGSYLDDLALYSEPDGPYHPAYLLAQANQILMMNVNLGPWIHVESRVQNFAVAKVGEPLNIRGRIIRSYQRRGHDMVDLDLVIFDATDRALTGITHTAIVRLKPPIQG